MKSAQGVICAGFVESSPSQNERFKQFLNDQSFVRLFPAIEWRFLVFVSERQGQQLPGAGTVSFFGSLRPSI